MASGILERGQAVGVTSTIFALSSGRPPAGIAVIRVSGPLAFDALRQTTGAEPPPRLMTLAAIRDPADGTLIDRGLVVRFSAPRSVTGDDLVEFHLHGGVAVVAAMLRVLGAMPGLVPSAPGAFTRRAFDNGRADLAQVEGLADLIAADTEAGRRQALADTSGALNQVVDRWRAALIALCADVEARLDFAEAEDDVATSLSEGTSKDLMALRVEMEAVLRDTVRGERLREGLTIAVVGPPNVGKSSLINALAKRDVAIVSEHAGTTRDVIEVRMELGGVAVSLIDTAGLRDADDPVEQEGIRRGRERAAGADRVLMLGVSSDDPCDIVAKIDLGNAEPGFRDGRWFLSAQTGAGVDVLLGDLTCWATEVVRPSEPAVMSRERQRRALADGLFEIFAAEPELDLVLRAEHLRRAIHALGVITGKVAVDDVLDSIFSQFCIGK